MKLLEWLRRLLRPGAPQRMSAAPSPGVRLRRHAWSALPPPHRPDPTLSRVLEDPPRWLALGRPDPGWRRPDARWDVPPPWRPQVIKRNPTKDYRRGYRGVWALDSRMKAVSRPYLLRSQLARVGPDAGPPDPGQPSYFREGALGPGGAPAEAPEAPGQAQGTRRWPRRAGGAG